VIFWALCNGAMRLEWLNFAMAPNWKPILEGPHQLFFSLYFSNPQGYTVVPQLRVTEVLPIRNCQNICQPTENIFQLALSPGGQGTFRQKMVSAWPNFPGPGTEGSLVPPIGFSSQSPLLARPSY